MSPTESATATQHSTPQSGTLEPFPGRYIPGVCFESGHCVWLLKFTATPTRFDAYTELWLITPDGDRILYTDPGEATEEVLHYHDFDRTGAASITVDVTESDIDVRMEADDGLTLELRASLAQSVGTRILNTIIALTPQPILRSRLGTSVSTLWLNLLVDANGLKVAGRTETKRRYRLDADRLHMLRDVSATVDGQDLGARQPPTRPLEFGDAKTTADALYVPGTLHLERIDD